MCPLCVLLRISRFSEDGPALAHVIDGTGGNSLLRPYKNYEHLMRAIASLSVVKKKIATLTAELTSVSNGFSPEYPV